MSRLRRKKEIGLLEEGVVEDLWARMEVEGVAEAVQTLGEGDGEAHLTGAEDEVDLPEAVVVEAPSKVDMLHFSFRTAGTVTAPLLLVLRFCVVGLGWRGLMPKVIFV
mmetsp:Transcript_21722/g.34026  ORF Transcript_21722/g.34026 Transcript_21722/m.34026 type:complete len:108 (-) Transcript_21722:76-399(-)